MDLLDYWFLDAAAELRQSVAIVCGESAGEALNRCHHDLDKEAASQRLQGLLGRGWISISASSLYGLTESGGAQWEKLAQPDWQRFQRIEYSSEPDECTVEAACPARLFEGISHTEAACGDFNWDPRQVAFTRLSPWRPVYWKLLPEGWRAVYPLAARSEPLGWSAGRQRALERYWAFGRWRTSPNLGNAAPG